MWKLALMLTTLGTACAIAPSESALCDGTKAARAAHAAALAEDDDDRAVLTGAYLIDLIDAGCK